MRLIDADAVEKITWREPTYKDPLNVLTEVRERIRELPTIDAVDAVLVIRCKDCKYYYKSDEECQLIKTRLHFYETNKQWTENSFCSWAERVKE